MIVFPNCKINLGLRVTGKRDDGYHDIETIFYPLPLKDALEINLPAKQTGQEFELTLWGNTIPGENNLCRKAWELIKNDFPDIGPVRMNLLKAIPIGAGLGGGSSDAAHALLLLNDALKLDISREQLIKYALQLGSDCPFFIVNKPCFATGRGEEMKEIKIDLDNYYFVLVNPEIHISTAWAFGNLQSKKSGSSLVEMINGPVSEWKNKLVNDFEEPVFKEYSSLKTIKDELYTAGAEYASLTGTGSCVYGIFAKKTEPDLHKISDHFKLYQLR